MINEIKCVNISCNKCEDIYEASGSGFSLFLDEGSADVSSDDWYEGFDNDGITIHYCPDCYEIDENDNLIIKQ